ncbi:EamA family transporter [Flavobacterium rhizosphaerae]|uniref:DMT family transporter n=1 Tax=Flavobacterium rhizosphaerae TaxID=3163298 RepID=A0ABW8YT77_9FLAO
MLYLFLSIICSVSVGIIFKTARCNIIRIPQIIFFNYIVALLLSYLFFDVQLPEDVAPLPWAVYIPLMLLLPSIFIFLAASIRNVGIVRTDAAQRLSLFIPILAAWLIFNEYFNTYKIIGLCLAFPALILILNKKADKQQGQWFYPVVVLLGFGIIDILFKQIALSSTAGYTTSLFIIFCGAIVVSFIIGVYEIAFKSKKFNAMNIAYGALVGIFNFGNILFYLMAHKAFSSNPSTVFAGMNLGVIIIGSLTGVLVFREKLSAVNYAGIFLAIAAIVFITLSQLYN